MQHNDLLNDLQDHLQKILPLPVNWNEEIKQQLSGIVENHLSRLNIVTREEFEIQKAVLLRTRQKLEQLEQKVHLLEEQQE